MPIKVARTLENDDLECALTIGISDNIFMPIPPKILELIERFEQHGEDYRAGKYNETQLRRDFLDPFLSNRKGEIQ